MDKKGKKVKKSTLSTALLAACGLWVSANALAATQPASQENTPWTKTTGPTFHDQAQAFNSKIYLPPPPKANSAAFTLDKAAYKAGYALKGTARWKQATQDADMSTPNVAHIFSAPLGVTISPQTTPELYRIMDYLNVDSGDYAPDAAK